MISTTWFSRLRKPATLEGAPGQRWTLFALVALVATYQTWQIWPALYVPWWFNTDEVFYFSEVARFLQGDFHQTYYDIPGTPLMMLTSVLVAGIWGFLRLTALTAYGTPYEYAFGEIQGVFTLMRLVTMVLAAIVPLLAYATLRRAGNFVAAAGAAVFTVSLPIYAQYSHFVRSESLGLCLCLGAWLLVQRAPLERRGRSYLWAGAFCGIAMAARFHFAAVGLPLLLTHFMVSGDRVALETRSKAVVVWNILLASFVAGGIYTLLVRVGIVAPSFLSNAMLVTATAPGAVPAPGLLAPPEVAGAAKTMAKLWVLLAGASAGVLGLGRLRRPRMLAEIAFHPWLCGFLVAFAFGFLASHPAFLWQGFHQLRSIEFYASWNDPALQARGVLGGWWAVTSYYFNTALPEIWLKGLFAVGVIASFAIARRAWWPVLATAAVCFLAHSPSMKLWPHHVMPWLPFLCAVALYPAGLAWEYFQKGEPARWLSWAGLTLAVMIGVLGIRPRLPKADEYYRISKARTEFISDLNGWLLQEAKPTEALFISYYAMNRDCIFKWIENRGVAVPTSVRWNREATVWWLNAAPLTGQRGLIAISPADIEFFWADFERKDPGKHVNPFTDARFTQRAVFGAGFYEIRVFSFDFGAAP